MTDYRIDDLARAAGTTTRNVRGYQDRGLIPRPVRRGRVAIYNDAHLERLKTINALLRRGFTMSHIAEFLSGVQRGDDLAAVLGLKGLVTEPWGATPSALASTADLQARLRTDDPEIFAQLVALGLLSPADDDAGGTENGGELPTQYLVRDTDTIDAYVELVEIGAPLSFVLGIQRQIDEDLRIAAKTLIGAGRRAITEGRFDGWIPESDAESDWAATFIGHLRRTGRVTAHNSLNRALDRELSRQLEDYLAVAKDRQGEAEAD